jgi:hypothetical protein
MTGGEEAASVPPMYLLTITLTMCLLPLGSIAAEWALTPAPSLLLLTGKWFVFWAVGVRLTLAGLRQVAAPDFTARAVFRIEAPEALPLVRELGFANLAAGVVGLASLAWPGFVLPAAIWGAIFLGAAGVMHARRSGRSRHESVAMVSDLFVALVLAGYVLTLLMATVTAEGMR